VAHPVNLIAGGKAGGGLLAAGNRLTQLVGLDGLELAVADVHAGNVPGAVPVGMGGAGVDGLEAPSVVGVLGEADLQLVEALVVPVEGALGAVNLHGDVVVTAPGVAGGLNAAHSAAGKLAQ